MANDIAAMAPELVILVGSLATVLLFGRPRPTGAWGPALAGIVALGVADLLLILALLGRGPVPLEAEPWGLLDHDAMAALLKILFISGTLLVVLALPGTLARNNAEAVGLLQLATVGAMIVASAKDLIAIYLGVELVSFSGYVLAGYLKRDHGSVEAGAKYFITGALGSGITLFGISLLYGLTGTVQIEALGERAAQVATAVLGQATPDMLATSGIFILIVLLILTGFGFKIAAVPFHWWTPDVYEGAPNAITAWLGGAGKVVALAALVKVFLVALLPYQAGWVALLGVLALATMTWGNLAALRQDDCKRMLAYSSIAHAGYILIAFPVATVASAQEMAIAGAVFHTATNVAMKGGAFLVVAALAAAGVGSHIDAWRGSARRHPWMGLAFAIFLLSLAGLPPLAGFFSKFVLFGSAIQASGAQGWMLVLAVAGILNSALSLWYYARWIGAMWLDAPHHVSVGRVPIGAGIAVIVSLVFTVLMGLVDPLGAAPSLQAAGTMVP